MALLDDVLEEVNKNTTDDTKTDKKTDQTTGGKPEKRPFTYDPNFEEQYGKKGKK